jgi:GLPGLI family protein
LFKFIFFSSDISLVRFKVYLIGLILFNFPDLSYGQEDKAVIVTYVQTTQFSVFWQRHYKLYANNEKALSVEIRKTNNTEVQTSPMGSDGSKFKYWEPFNDTPEFFYREFKKPSVKFMENVFDKLIYVDDTVSMNWNFVKETKLIKDFVCNKATVKHRGRDYVAWYTKQIPISAGPYKFSGLPGLILEIISIDNEVQFIAKNLSYGNHKDLTINDLTQKNKQSISFQNFSIRKGKIIDDYFRRQHAKRAGELIPYEKCEDCRELGIEKVYEWETEDEEKK